MTTLLQTLRHASRFLWQPVSKPITSSFNRVSRLSVPLVQLVQEKHFKAGYDPSPEIKVRTPYKKPQQNRYGYSYKLFDGGLMPRPKGAYEDRPLPMPHYDPVTKDAWTRKKALFGQNDYIDILGDGNIHPWQLMKGPLYLRGFKGNELQRLLRRMKFQGNKIKTLYPKKYNDWSKRINYLYRFNNKRRTAPYWKGKMKRSRIDRIRGFS